MQNAGTQTRKLKLRLLGEPQSSREDSHSGELQQETAGARHRCSGTVPTQPPHGGGHVLKEDGEKLDDSCREQPRI